MEIYKRNVHINSEIEMRKKKNNLRASAIEDFLIHDFPFNHTAYEGKKKFIQFFLVFFFYRIS